MLWRLVDGAMIVLPYRNLRVWRKAHELTLVIHRLSQTIPKSAGFSLKDQMCRSSSSVAANIVEGFGHQSKKELARYLRIARASALETTYHCLLSRDLGYFDKKIANQLIDEYNGLSAGLTKFIKRLKSDNSSTPALQNSK